MSERRVYKLEAFDLVQLVLTKYHDHQMHGVIKLNGHVKEKILMKAVMESTKDLPHIACRLKKSWIREYWSKGDFIAEDIVKVIKSDLSETRVMKFLTRATDTFNGPQLSITILRDEETDILCVVMNHMLCDGAGFKSYLYLICDLYNSITRNSEPQIRYNPLDRGIGQVVKARNIKTETKRNELVDDGVLVKMEGDVNRPFIVTEKISRNEFMLIKDYAKKEKVTINDVFMSAYIFGIRNIMGLNITSMTGTVDLRKYLKDKKANGLTNMAGFITCSIDKRSDLEFKDILRQVSQSMKEEKESTNCLKQVAALYKGQKYLPYNILKKVIGNTLYNAPIAFTNIGILEKAYLKFDGLDVEDAFVTGAIKYVPNFQMAVSTFDNRVRLSINLYGSRNDEIKIRSFLKKLKLQLINEVNKTAC